MQNWVFKILRASEWQAGHNDRSYTGAPVDLADGYIHFSTIDQLQETADKYFSGESIVHIIVFAVASWTDELRWEPSRGGQLFPHLYRPLDMTIAAKNWTVEKETGARFDITAIAHWAKNHD